MTTATLSKTEIEELHQADNEQTAKETGRYFDLLDRRAAGEAVNKNEVVSILKENRKTVQNFQADLADRAERAELIKNFAAGERVKSRFYELGELIRDLAIQLDNCVRGFAEPASLDDDLESQNPVDLRRQLKTFQEEQETLRPLVMSMASIRAKLMRTAPQRLKNEEKRILLEMKKSDESRREIKQRLFQNGEITCLKKALGQLEKGDRHNQENISQNPNEIQDRLAEINDAFQSELEKLTEQYDEWDAKLISVQTQMLRES